MFIKKNDYEYLRSNKHDAHSLMVRIYRGFKTLIYIRYFMQNLNILRPRYEEMTETVKYNDAKDNTNNATAVRRVKMFAFQ
jgi:hypothetical protein